MSAPRIVIAAGGTAGHVVPAIAIADALRAEGAEVVFVGGERAEAELVPAAGYPLEPIRVEGISRSNPLKAARARPQAGGALGAARGGSCARHEPTRCSAAAATSAGPVGLAAVRPAIPLVLTEADSHLGLTNRLLARARPPRLPRLPDRGPRRRRATCVTGRAVPPTVTDRAAARERFGIGDGRALRARLRRLARRALDQPGRASRAFADAPFRVLHIAGRRDFADLAAPGAALRPARLRRRRSARRWPPPTSPSPAPAARSSSSPSTACPPS